MVRRGPTAWRARPRSSTPKANAMTPAAWPNPSRNGAAMTAGAAIVWIAACAPNGIVVRVLPMTPVRLRTYVRSVCAGDHTTHLPRFDVPACTFGAHGAAPDRHAPRRARARRLTYERGRVRAGGKGQDRARRAAGDETGSARVP